jgi:7,8-dihydropterin-6-yl-methyl-4-(beta-D-ribofuranosyl)aminobenzene 5'-phosphate synthase
MSLKITTLVENNSDKNNILYSEHGLSLYIEINDKKILFDTGQSGDFIKNAEKIKIDLNDLDYVVLSHGHYDHSGGFGKLVQNTSKSFKLIVGSGFFCEKYKLMEGERYKFNGNSFNEEFIMKSNISIKYINQDIINITEDRMIFSNFERKNNFETLNKKFYIKENDKYVLDDFSDEIALGIKHDKGLVIMLDVHM